MTSSGPPVSPTSCTERRRTGGANRLAESAPTEASAQSVAVQERCNRSSSCDELLLPIARGQGSSGRGFGRNCTIGAWKVLSITLNDVVSTTVKAKSGVATVVTERQGWRLQPKDQTIDPTKRLR